MLGEFDQRLALQPDAMRMLEAEHFSACDINALVRADN